MTLRYSRRIHAKDTSAELPKPASVAEREQTVFSSRRFKILGKLTSGEPAELYLVQDRQLSRRITLKLLHAKANYDPVAAKLLEREARLLGRIDHPNVVGVLDVGRLGTDLCMTLQSVGHNGLDDWIDRGQHGPAEVLAVLKQAGRGLAAAHAAGVVHGDLTPQRVRVDRLNQVRLVDFERARDLTPEPGAWEHSGPPLPITPSYAAPETDKNGRRDRLTDQYGFCVLAWEALAGRRPPSDPMRSAGSREYRREPAYRALARGLDHRPTARWPDMDHLIDALESSNSRRLGIRRRVLLGTAFALALLGVSLSVFGGEARPQVPSTLAGTATEAGGHSLHSLAGWFTNETPRVGPKVRTDAQALELGQRWPRSRPGS